MATTITSSKGKIFASHLPPFQVGNQVPKKLLDQFDCFNVEYNGRHPTNDFRRAFSPGIVGYTEDKRNRIIQLPDGTKVFQIRCDAAPDGYMEPPSHTYVSTSTVRDRECEMEELWATSPMTFDRPIEEGELSSTSSMGMVDIGKAKDDVKALSSSGPGSLANKEPFEGTDVGKIPFYFKNLDANKADFVKGLLEFRFTCTTIGCRGRNSKTEKRLVDGLCVAFDCIGRWDCQTHFLAHTINDDEVRFRVRADHHSPNEDEWDVNDSMTIQADIFNTFPKDRRPRKEAVTIPYMQEKGFIPKSGYYESNKSAIIEANVVIYRYDIKTAQAVFELADECVDRDTFYDRLIYQFDTTSPNHQEKNGDPCNFLVQPKGTKRHTRLIK